MIRIHSGGQSAQYPCDVCAIINIEMEKEGQSQTVIGGVKLQNAGIVFIIFAAVLIALLSFSVLKVSTFYSGFTRTSQTYAELENAAESYQDAASFLTSNARDFVSTGRRLYLDEYFRELYETKRCDTAQEQLRRDGSPAVVSLCDEAEPLLQSQRKQELYAMCLYIDSLGMKRSDFHSDFESVELSAADARLSAAAKQRKALSLIYSSEYETDMHALNRILEQCQDTIVQDGIVFQRTSSDRLRSLMYLQSLLIGINIALMCAILYVGYYLILRPQHHIVQHMADHEELPLEGVHELRYIASTYNSIYEENQNIRDQLSFEALHDKLTGLYNRREFDRRRMQGGYGTLVLIDIDEFKKFNDVYGHETGDRVLMRVAQVLRKDFRRDDIICRYGGDEFAVLMRGVTAARKGRLEERCIEIQKALDHEQDGIPPVTLSIGIALEDRKTETNDAFRDADTALYEVKRHGRNGYTFYSAAH